MEGTPPIPPDPRFIRPGSQKPRPAPAQRGAVGGASNPTPSPLADVSARLAEGVSAYPGSVTYIDLMAKSRRQSVILIALMILLGGALGASIGGFIASLLGPSASTTYEFVPGGGVREVRTETGEAPGIVPGLVVGGLLGLAVASLAALWSYYGGAKAILGMVHATPVRKEEDPELHNVTEEMAIAAGIPMPKLYLIPDKSLNAFATGRDPAHGVVAITTGLREKLTRDELQGVIAHEIAHIRHYDIRFAMLMATMVGLIVIVSDAFLRTMFYSAAGASRAGRGASKGGKGGGAIIMLVIAVVLAALAPLFARIIQMAYSRQREYLADAGAVELTRNPTGIASALAKLGADRVPMGDTANRGMAHMFIICPMKKMRESGQSLNSMFSSHPPLKERLTRLLALMR